MHTYIHPYIHTYIHTYLHTYIHTYILTYLHTYIHIRMHTYACIGAHINARDANLRSPLHMAARWGRHQTAEALLTLGADVAAKDCDDLPPVDHAWYYKVCV